MLTEEIQKSIVLALEKLVTSFVFVYLVKNYSSHQSHFVAAPICIRMNECA